MYETHVVDCSYLIDRLTEDVPQHVTSGRLNTRLVNRIVKRLLTQAIFDVLPTHCSDNRINLADYRLLENLDKVELERLLEDTADALKGYMYNNKVGLTQNKLTRCIYDGRILYLVLEVGEDEDT